MMMTVMGRMWFVSNTRLKKHYFNKFNVYCIKLVFLCD